MSLTEFLLARIAEDEAAAEAAPGRVWTSYDKDSVAGASVYDEQWVLLYPQIYDHDKALSSEPGATGPKYIELARDDLVAHIARWDPARVLAECEAKRRVIERAVFVDGHGPAVDHLRALDMTTGASGALRDVLGFLAQPYADHPDFHLVWRAPQQ